MASRPALQPSEQLQSLLERLEAQDAESKSLAPQPIGTGSTIMQNLQSGFRWDFSDFMDTDGQNWVDVNLYGPPGTNLYGYGWPYVERFDQPGVRYLIKDALAARAAGQPYVIVRMRPIIPLAASPNNMSWRIFMEGSTNLKIQVQSRFVVNQYANLSLDLSNPKTNYSYIV